MTIHLCFTCDPFPNILGVPSLAGIEATQKVIRMLKDAGTHVQILTKNPSGACINVHTDSGLYIPIIAMLDENDNFCLETQGGRGNIFYWTNFCW